ncbi:MAG: pyridoxine 5'-phosphate synthase [Candidatus Margulisbacteria bacterium]|nr:pyridoxine 5'-phosphate synthase [Candidatus Margulisiibacteriota bacterium]
MTRLGVNIDHIATLRQARLESFPDPVELAREAIAGGADGVVCHLREDRRHILDKDVIALRRLKTRLDLEMAATTEMLGIALKIKPDMVTLVPEKRQEITTEGGLDVVKHRRKLKPIIKKLQDRGIQVSLFIDSQHEQVEESAVLMTDFIELHTGKYARSSYIKGRKLTVKRELEKVGIAAQQARWIGLRINAGHGLDYHNVKEICRIPGIEELNIGFSIIARSVVVGMRQAVIEMRRAMR